MEQTTLRSSSPRPINDHLQRHGWFIFVAKEDGDAADLSAELQRYGCVRRAVDMQEVTKLVRSGRSCAGLVIDRDLLGASLLCELQALRALDGLVPILVLAARVVETEINALHLLRAELVVKPFHGSHVVSFARRALVAGFIPDERVSAAVAELAARLRLTAREVQLLVYSLGDEPRSRMMRRLGITENTLKTQVRSLLRKCGSRTLDGLARNVLRETLIMGAPCVTRSPAAPAAKALAPLTGAA